jgi:L-seryl-tRNA(Ser) seleniumtransferase
MTDVADALRALPSVDRLAAELAGEATPAEAVAAARAAIDECRAQILAGDEAGPGDLVFRAREHLRPSLRRVLNATGVIIHTNLGRAPLADAAAEAVTEAARGYVNLELDLDTGRRGARDAHVAALLAELTGAQDALVVNNGAAAVLLAAAGLGGPGAAIVVSRGQLVEIGGGFRIPDVVAQAGARLVEVGTTNRTRRLDYEAALAAQRDAGTRAVILRVHPSNFRTVGFTEEVGIDELTTLGAPVVDDLGSGVLATGLDHLLADEPSARASLAAGAALVCFSGDKLLGGPQAGILAGTADAVAACRRHPLARALRIGRLPMAALAATLALYRDPDRARREIPVLAMLTADDATLATKADTLLAAAGVHGERVTATARAGGGALPLLELPGPAVAVSAPDPDALASRLRAHDPPVLARIADGRVILDPRTLSADEVDTAADALRAALAQRA